MRKRVARFLSVAGIAVALSTTGLALTPAPANALPLFECFYDESGTYIGARSTVTGARYTPEEITQYGCENY